MCHHMPECPDGQAPDAMAARVVAGHPEQGWSLLCDGVVLSRTRANCFRAARRLRLPASALGPRLAEPPRWTWRG